MTVALIADIVGSRSLTDRDAAQRRIEKSLAAASGDLPGSEATFRATVGDEFQAASATLSHALGVVLLVQLDLPDGIALRYGLGVGDIRPLDSAATGLSDGPGWWAARDALVEVRSLERKAVPGARTWIVGTQDHDERMTAEIALANAYALVRDALVAGMSERVRRLVRGRCLGLTQRTLADAEGVTQSAVSQALGASGAAAVVTGFTTLIGASR